MIITIIALALSVSIDAFGIGITYGLRKTKLSTSAKFILFFVSFIFASLSVVFGYALIAIFPEKIIKIISVALLIIMGVVIIYEAMKDDENDGNYLKCNKGKSLNKGNINEGNTGKNLNSKKTNKKELKIEPKIYKIFLKPLGITIQIIRNPISSDLDNSKVIEKNEAIYLALALSLDSICVGITSTSFGLASLLFPILVPLFQFIFLNVGINLGKGIVKYNTSFKKWNIISGILLVVIGLLRIFI